MKEIGHSRRAAIGAGGVGVAGGLIAAAAAGASLIDPKKAYAQAAGDSLLRTVLDRGNLIVGTGSTNAPWHFEDEQGKLTGMDIAMARILAKGLFDDETKIEFVLQDPAARIPNIATGKVDITIQFMTVTPGRAQQVAFTRPYYIEGIALLTKPGSPMQEFAALEGGGANTKVSILQNVDAEQSVHCGAAAGAGAADRHPGQRHPGARGRSGRRGGGRSVDGRVDDQARARQVRRQRQALVQHALQRGRCGRATPIGCTSSTRPGTSRCSATRTRSSTRRSPTSSA